MALGTGQALSIDAEKYVAVVKRNRQSQIDEVFLAALKVSPECRASFLDEQCKGFDSTIRREVEQLLDGSDCADAANLSQSPWNLAGYLGSAADGANSATSPKNDVIEDASQIGSYRLLRKLGEGGMGTVYLADQLRPVQRQVALKIIKPGMDSRQVISRFEAERQALALMDHPNIARVFDASTTENGHPYFVMELVQGPSITTYCDTHQLPIRRRLELFIQVCHAVQHAHQKGIIHRDIKPSNVLISTSGPQANPKVIDFGIAKAIGKSLTEETRYTHFGQVVGTPAYMSPEQAHSERMDIDTRSDIYSLGVLLYELLTGSTPLDNERVRSSGFERVVRLIREEDAQRPSACVRSTGDAAMIAANRGLQVRQLNAVLVGDPDWIVLRALEKDRDRRYDTADALAADVRRYLNDEPIVARPPSSRYRVMKMFRRNRRTVIAVAVVFLSLIVGIFATTMQWLRSNQLARRLQESAYVADMMLANQARQVGDMTRVAELLERNVPAVGSRDLRRFEWDYLARLYREVRRAHLMQGRGAIDRLGFVGRNGKPQLAVVQDQELRIFAHSTFDNRAAQRGAPRPLHRATTHYSNRWYWTPCVAISTSGDRFATVTNFELSVCDSRTGESLHVIDLSPMVQTAPERSSTDPAVASSMAFSANDKWLATGHWDGTLTVWSVSESGDCENVLARRIHDRAIVGVGFGVESELVVTASWDRRVGLTKFISESDGPVSSSPTTLAEYSGSATGAEQVSTVYFDHDSEINDAVISPDGKRVYSISQRGRLSILDRTTRNRKVVDEGVIVFAVAVSPDGRLVAVGGEDGMIRIRDAVTGSMVARLRGHAGGLRELAFSADGSTLASGGDLGHVCLWAINDQLAFRSDAFARRPGVRPAERMLDVAETSIFDLEFHPTRPILAATAQNRVSFWDLEQEVFEQPIDGADRFRSVSFSADGQLVVVGSWGEREKHNTHCFELSPRIRAADFASSFDANAAKFNSDGHYLILSRDYPDATKKADIFVFDTHEGKMQLELKSCREYQFGYGVDRFALSPDNRTLVLFAHVGVGREYDAMIFAWDLLTKELIWKSPAHNNPIHSLEFSPDGKILVSTSDDHTIKFWEPTEGTHIRTLKGHRSWVMESVFMPAGDILATASVDGTVRLWDVATGHERFVLQGDGTPLQCIDISPDGATVAAGDMHGKIWIWHAGTDSRGRP